MKIPLRGGPFDGSLLNAELVLPGDSIHLVESVTQCTEGDFYLMYRSELRHVANRPEGFCQRFRTDEVSKP